MVHYYRFLYWLAVFLSTAAVTTVVVSFQSPIVVFQRSSNRRQPHHFPTTTTAISLVDETVLLLEDTSNNNNVTEARPCYYKNHRGRWSTRNELGSLSIGQALECTIPEQNQVLEGRTGNKIYCECGVGRTRDGSTWKMVFGLLRLDRKVSAAKKRLSRLRSKPFFTGYVSQIRPSNDQFEIILSLDDLPKAQKMVSCGSLKVGQEVVGRVERVEPYGVLVTVEVDGATVNRHGLLHIQKVADLFGQFINKEEGLKKAGLGRGERVKLQVTALASKRLSLDFTEDVKANARQEQEDIAKQRELKRNPPLADASRTVSGPGSVDVEEGADELEANDDEVDWEEEGDEGYDEDRDIEDQLGLGSY